MTKNEMVAEILCVGTELLIGDVVNTNAAFLSKRLADIGIAVSRHIAIGDDSELLCRALEDSLGRVDIVVMSGGLGPTKDDLTKETVAKYFGRQMRLHEESLLTIREYFCKTGRKMTANNEKQAMMPEGAVVFPNRYGTAPALAIEEGKKTVIMLPGPPVELRPLFNEEVFPYLEKKCNWAIVSQNVHFFGIGESALAEKLDKMLTESENPSVAPYCQEGEVRLCVTARGESKGKAQQLCAQCVKQILDSEVGCFAYGVDTGTIENALVIKLREKGMTLSVAESCTGGLIAKRITDISGCSDVFLGGYVTYNNEIKQRLVNVNKNTLDTYSAVSAQVAMEMAKGARELTGSDIAVSATGIAGPSGGTETTPVGTVYLGISTKRGEDFRKLTLSSNRSREYIRTVSATNAYDMIMKYLDNKYLL